MQAQGSGVLHCDLEEPSQHATGRVVRRRVHGNLRRSEMLVPLRNTQHQALTAAGLGFSQESLGDLE